MKRADGPVTAKGTTARPKKHTTLRAEALVALGRVCRRPATSTHTPLRVKGSHSLTKQVSQKNMITSSRGYRGS